MIEDSRGKPRRIEVATAHAAAFDTTGAAAACTPLRDGCSVVVLVDLVEILGVLQALLCDVGRGGPTKIVRDRYAVVKEATNRERVHSLLLEQPLLVGL